MMGICGVCGVKRRLGRCQFAGGRADVVEHCRGCCSTPERDHWRPVKIAKPRAKASALRRAPGLHGR